MGTGTELASLQILSRLEAVGIRALPLNGSILARRLYGDVAVRSSIDIDILIAPEDLTAVAAVAELGWRWDRDAWRVGGLPVLRETLFHTSLPRLELHWRVHWYERRFAIDALARAERPAIGEPLQMQPLDGLIAVMLFYARDGFAGLRFPADAAAWWDVRCAGSESPLSTDAIVGRYPDLAGPVRVASNLLSGLVGVPTERSNDLPFRWRVAAGLATPFLEGGRQQVDSNAALTDLVLARPRAARGALRRVLHKGPRPFLTVRARTVACTGRPPPPRRQPMGGRPRARGRAELRSPTRRRPVGPRALKRSGAQAGSQRGEPLVPLSADFGDPRDSV